MLGNRKRAGSFCSFCDFDNSDCDQAAGEGGEDKKQIFLREQASTPVLFISAFISAKMSVLASLEIWKSILMRAHNT
ncbi:MAG: hypothetical protein WC726_03790 [Parcubacteria group bacterium]|jgi:hypothetical protein